ncbi:coactosin-like protein [Rhopilema esculentum]|uniref:coactosin-like protein n=1 Tax=Rhopilema esculentum TaxID=499914 RepID=UPI0031D388AC
MSADRDSIMPAYEDVRNDSSETTWAAFSYSEDGKTIAFDESGNDYSQFLAKLNDDNRVYGFVRMETGDEMSKRAKFVFITWIGKNVSTLKKAKVSTDKAFVKQICNNFAVEILESDIDQLSGENVLALVKKAGGANYGTGVRD